MPDWKMRPGYGRGMTLSFMPGLRDTGHDIVESGRQRDAALAGLLECVHISDEAYSIVEICIGRHLSQYSGFLRYGLFTITAEQWQPISKDLLHLGRRFRMRSVRQIGLPAYWSNRWNMRHSRKQCFDGRIEIANMLDDLRQKLDKWTVTWAVINVHGI